MAWFHRTKKGILTKGNGKSKMPEGQWEKCPNCGAINNQRELKASLRVCPKCGYHYRMNPEGLLRAAAGRRILRISGPGCNRERSPGIYR